MKSRVLKIIMIAFLFICCCRDKREITVQLSHSEKESSKIEDSIKDDTIVVDPYCGLKLKKSEAKAKAVYKGKVYYFCMPDHRDAFLKSPEKYIKKEE